MNLDAAFARRVCGVIQNCTALHCDGTGVLESRSKELTVRIPPRSLDDIRWHRNAQDSIGICAVKVPCLRGIASSFANSPLDLTARLLNEVYFTLGEFGVPEMRSRPPGCQNVVCVCIHVLD
jgi:hypothetical protein